MKILRPILTSCFIAIAVFITGDLYYRQTGLLDHFAVEAPDNSDFFVAEKMYGDYREDKLIFCDESIRNKLEKNYDIYEGSYKSIVSGEFNIKYYPYENLDEDVIRENPHGYSSYYDGEITNIKIKVFYIIILVSILLYVILQVYYDTTVIKNEMFIKLSMGNIVSHSLFLKASIISSVYLISFVISVILKRKLFGTNFLDRYAFLVMGFIIAFVYLQYESILLSDVKTGLSKIAFSEKALSMMYFTKLLQMIALSIVTIVTARSFDRYNSLSQQKELYDEFKDYDSVVISPNDRVLWTDGEYNLRLNKIFYEKFYEDFDIKLFQETTLYGSELYEVAYNSNMAGYLMKKFPEGEEIFNKYDTVVFVPAGAENDKEVLLYAKKSASAMSDVPVYEIPVYVYKQDKKFIVQSDGDVYELSRNPVIVYGGKYDNAMYLQSCILKTDSEKIKEFSRQYNCRVTVSSAYDQFIYVLYNAKKILFINTALMIILIILTTVMSISLLKTEFDMNKMEIVIRKTMGEGLSKRILKPIIPSIFATFVGVMVSAGVCSYLSEQKLLLMCIPVFIISALDIIFVFIFSYMIENENITKSLKGVL